MARQTETRGYGSSVIVLIAVALLIFWAGHDTAGALALIHRIAEGIASAANHSGSTRK